MAKGETTVPPMSETSERKADQGFEMQSKCHNKHKLMDRFFL